MYFDANVVYEEKERATCIETAIAAIKCGFSGVLLNHIVDGKPSLDRDDGAVAIPEEVIRTISDVASRSCPAPLHHRGAGGEVSLPRVGRRLTVAAHDAATLVSIAPGSSVVRGYDVVAVLPLGDDRLLQQCCGTVDADLIVVESTGIRNVAGLRRSNVSVALSRGIHFELSIAGAIRDPDCQRTLVAAGLQLSQVSSHGRRGIVLSSGAMKPWEARGPLDIANLGVCFGMTQEGAHAALSTNVRSLLAKGFSRKSTFKGIACVKSASSDGSAPMEIVAPAAATATTTSTTGASAPAIQQKKKKTVMAKK